MGSMRTLYSVEDIRSAETALFARQQRADELMQSAAHAVATVTQNMLATQEDPVLLLVGPGGNGGDALYAGAVLAMQGKRVEAYAIAGTDNVHERASQAFTAAGGSFVALGEDKATTTNEPSAESCRYGVIVDGMFGLGGRGEIPDEVDEVLRAAKVLAIDIPSGVVADTGKAPGKHVRADVTITFGGLREPMVSALHAERCSARILVWTMAPCSLLSWPSWKALLLCGTHRSNYLLTTISLSSKWPAPRSHCPALYLANQVPQMTSTQAESSESAQVVKTIWARVCWPPSRRLTPPVRWCATSASTPNTSWPPPQK